MMGGYTCFLCGLWIQTGRSHYCSGEGGGVGTGAGGSYPYIFPSYYPPYPIYQPNKAQICPVCKGKGKYLTKKCHGCLGKGWVKV